jgi:hypothetical protein
MMTEQELVKKCMVLVCHSAGFDTNHRLTQRDMELLCDNIEKKTNVLISLSTMKRLLNGQFSRMPQVATLNAISNYLGYANWQEFKIKQQAKEEPPKAAPAKAPAKPNKTLPFIGAGIVALVVVVLLAYSKFSLQPSAMAKKAEFGARKTTSHELPNTVVFNYNIDELEGDSFFIQQSWDRNRRVRIYKNNYTLTDIYYEPGYHKAKLIVNDQVIKTVDVSIPTNGWFFYAVPKAKGSLPIYIKTNRIAGNGIMGVEEKELSKHGINSANEHVYCYTYFPGIQPVSSDNFIMKARMKVTNLSNVACLTLMPEVYTQNSFIYFKATTPGCTSEIDAMFGEKHLSGKTNDLSGFGCNITQWQDYEMEVRNRQVTVRINGKEVFATTYNNSADAITGLGFISNGLVAVDYAELQGLDGTIIYGNQFNQP